MTSQDFWASAKFIYRVIEQNIKQGKNQLTCFPILAALCFISCPLILVLHNSCSSPNRSASIDIIKGFPLPLFRREKEMSYARHEIEMGPICKHSVCLPYPIQPLSSFSHSVTRIDSITREFHHGLIVYEDTLIKWDGKLNKSSFLSAQFFAELRVLLITSSLSPPLINSAAANFG